MALLERVSTLLRANLNDLLAKSEDPEKLAAQLILDMENQLVQVKTQVAIALAEQHKLKHKQAEEVRRQAAWQRKAELAVVRGEDGLARTALERGLTHERMVQALAQQHADQTVEVDTLRGAYTRLEKKLTETRHRVELLTLQLRRARATRRVPAAPAADASTLERLTARAEQSELEAHTARALLSLAEQDPLEKPVAQRNEAIEALLRDLKARLG